jgi:lipid II isoglutaminyl synthase (glutamine-hydrolysing)
MIKLYLSLLIGKLINSFCHLFPFVGGSALPGLIALKINPTLINQITTNNQLETIIITGTNGKTTTSRLTSHLLNFAKINHLHNRSGSNLLRGVASTLINQSSLTGKLPYNFAIFEIDEAVVPKAIKALNPKIILFTNLFRDQLDRYGEIDTLLSRWQQAIQSLSKTSTLIYNADDPSLNYLASTTKIPTMSYGLPQSLKAQAFLSDSADAIFCPHCQHPLKFTAIFTSHLGHYHCSNCSFKRNTPTIKFTSHKTNLPGLHNLYNLQATKSILDTLDIKIDLIKALSTFTPAFGRSESFKLKNLHTHILLVKNPTGFNVTLETLSSQKHLDKPLLLILNDQIADGTDVSWIWDVNFNLLKSRSLPVIVSGSRHLDLALRLKYAGLKPSSILIKPNIKEALKLLSTQPGRIAYILPTYTAMLALRAILESQKLLHSTWKD